LWWHVECVQRFDVLWFFLGLKNFDIDVDELKCFTLLKILSRFVFCDHVQVGQAI
jgi:hypothetical protein